MRMRAQMLRAVVTLVAQKGGNVLSRGMCHMVADLLTKAVARVVYHELLRLFDAYAATGVVCPD